MSNGDLVIRRNRDTGITINLNLHGVVDEYMLPL